MILQRVSVQPLLPRFLCSRFHHDLHPSIPQEILDQLDFKKPLANSVNIYDRHFSVSTGQYNWPATTKEDIKHGSEFHLSQFVMDWASVLKPGKTMYTKSSHSSPLPCIHIYPDNVKVEFKAQPTLDQICQFQTDWTSMRDLLTVSPLPSNTVHIYVCCHTARDIRCGVIGELLISCLRKFISAPPSNIASSLKHFDVRVFGCSHVGGHKYAGNVVIYRGDWKQGIWYGRVTPENVAEIVGETIIKGKIVGRHWRGGLPDGNWDPKEHISAEEAEERSCPCQRV